MKSFRGWAACAAFACLILVLPAWSDVSGLTWSVSGPDINGFYTYTFNVHYGADLSSFGHFETEFLGALNTDSVPIPVPSPVTPPAGFTGIDLYNAADFGLAHPLWTDAQATWESPDQEGFDPDVSEADFGTTGHDTAAGDYTFQYKLDTLLDSIHWEMQTSAEAEGFSGTIDLGGGGGTLSVPEPGSVALLLMGLPALGLLRRRIRK